jgi:hypothetical protein
MTVATGAKQHECDFSARSQTRMICRCRKERQRLELHRGCARGRHPACVTTVAAFALLRRPANRSQKNSDALDLPSSVARVHTR